MEGTPLEVTGQSRLVKQQLYRNSRLADYVGLKEGSHEELEDIVGRLRLLARVWDPKDPSDSKAVANLGREFGKWAISASSAAAVIPVWKEIVVALAYLYDIMSRLIKSLQPQVAKSMMQDIVWELTDLTSTPESKEICIIILRKYAEICSGTADYEEEVKCCKKGITLAEEHPIDKCWLHLSLGYVNMNMLNTAQAETELDNARNAIRCSLEDPESIELMARIEGAEGGLEMTKANNTPDFNRKQEHYLTAVQKLQSSLRGLREISSGSAYAKLNLVKSKLMLVDALRSIPGKLAETKHACVDALDAALELNLPSLITSAVFEYIDLVDSTETREKFLREGLKSLAVNEGDEPLLPGRLYGKLGQLLRERGESYLPDAETALRQSIKEYSRVLAETTRTSEFRITCFENLKGCFIDLQSLLYDVYVKAEENQRGVKAMDALIVAEQGRCRDLTLNLQELLISRIGGNEELRVDDNLGVMDWKKFDTDVEYARGHLEKCMAICTEAIKEQNSEVERVTFVEYTVTGNEILIYVFHSFGTEEPSTAHTTSTLPSICRVNVREAFKNVVIDGDGYPALREVFERLCKPQEFQSHYNNSLKHLQSHEAVNILEASIEDLRSDPEPQKRYLMKLYEVLISPIADKLAAGEPVIFISHEGLSFVPYAALQPKGGKHLIESHPIGVASSLRTLGWATKEYEARKARNAMSDKNQMLLVADPFPLGVAMDPLEDAIDEVVKIAAMLPQSSTKTLCREDATLEAVISDMKTTLWCHFACHGKVTAENPQGVLFFGKPTSNGADASSCERSQQYKLGFLTPDVICKDVGSMTAHVAVLAACEVGFGKKTGEGLLALSRAFLQAGVPLVVAPLRGVDSELSCAFMQRLYEKLVAGESMMFALRNTMVDVIKKRVKVEVAGQEYDDEEDDEIKWKVWDWAAWLAVGFPGVRLPSLRNPNMGDLQHTEAKLQASSK